MSAYQPSGTVPSMSTNAFGFHGRVDARHARQVAAHSWIAERARAREQREPSQATKHHIRPAGENKRERGSAERQWGDNQPHFGVASLSDYYTGTPRVRFSHRVVSCESAVLAMISEKGIVSAGAAAAALAWYARYRGRTPTKRRVVITGGCGNLGTKLATRLLAAGTWEVVLLEHPDFVPRDGSRVPRGATVVAGDLADGTASWEAALRGADCLVHFSAVNPYPNASWEESAGSMSHTFNVFLAASRHRVRCFELRLA